MLPKELGGCRKFVTKHNIADESILVGVVDPLTLKVYGTDNLRIVDASLMPMLIAAHPQRTVYAIAERVSHVQSRWLSYDFYSPRSAQASDIIKGRLLA